MIKVSRNLLCMFIIGEQSQKIIAEPSHVRDQTQNGCVINLNIKVSDKIRQPSGIHAVVLNIILRLREVVVV